ncbi:MAG TPA: ABC transporter permease [Jatrophihabitantaceae bacterium]|jgi:ABC-2 type transport system permease protein
MTQLLGTNALVQLGMRRDRIMIPVWLYALIAVVASTGYSYGRLYDTRAARLGFASAVATNGSTLAFYGHVYNADSIGGLTAWRLSGIGAALTAAFTVLLVVRHTRADEEAGRLELIGAGVVGRYAPLTTGVVIALGADAALAGLVLIAQVAVGLPFAGAVAFALGWFGAGLVFAAVAAVTAQIAETSRVANGLAFGVLGLAYLLRAVGDAGPSWVSWLSPIGWSQQLRPYAGERWWVLGLFVALAAVIGAVAYGLVERRDIGAGLLPTRPGPAAAAPTLRSPLALAWRLQRGLLAGWAVALLIYGAVIGGIADGIDALVQESKGTRDIITDMGGTKSLIDAFLATAAGLLGLAAAVYAVQAVLRLRTEETEQRAEPLLATRVGRIRWALSHVTIAVAGSVVLLALGGLSAGLAHGLRSHDVGHQLPRVLGAALAQLPATWVVTAVALALFGLRPRAAPAGWGVLGACLLLWLLGPSVHLAQWAMDISPFTHIPKLPGSAFSTTPLALLTAIAVLVAAAGLAALRRRDIG